MSREEQDAIVTKYLRAFVTGEQLGRAASTRKPVSQFCEAVGEIARPSQTESGRFTGGKPVVSRTPDGWDAGRSTALPQESECGMNDKHIHDCTGPTETCACGYRAPREPLAYRAEKKVGDVIEAGELLLFTQGCYSDFGVNGIYRAKKQFVMPGKLDKWSREMQPDIYGVSADPELVEELSYTEVWKD